MLTILDDPYMKCRKQYQKGVFRSQTEGYTNERINPDWAHLEKYLKLCEVSPEAEKDLIESCLNSHRCQIGC